MVIADHADNYGQARGFEQAHIEVNGTLDTSAKGKDPKKYPGNRARSYDPARADELALVEPLRGWLAGRAALRWPPVRAWARGPRLVLAGDVTFGLLRLSFAPPTSQAGPGAG